MVEERGQEENEPIDNGSEGDDNQKSSESDIKLDLNLQQEDQQAEVNNLKDQLLRMVAENENLRKRNLKQVNDLKKYAIADFAKKMVVVVENFHLIIQNAPKESIEKNEDLQKFYKGIEITHSDLESLFEKSGIVRIYPLGEKFDPNLHQVVSQVKSEKEPGTVIQVLQAGYTLNERIIKESMVVISELK
jgi:molecular chaperone GrpE